ncbi:serine/threonine-protein kinase [Paraliomyxa miuraensis]|uniref:serine/threonine-protein kinase n=1 Tax=Paraliomyxa miuraensis TaxID=376150 RepID=UPI002259A28E|nr:serine/threonine-protein kinase [Paraliomyxa miuraensis]MCX4245833.1 serine/threonine protein kinase [Paraliomyxa miuraensis]
MSIPDRLVLDDMSPPPPTSRLGRYEITGRIATGGMATVYLARLEATGGFAREFALKVVHPHLVSETGFRQRFHQEARLASRVRHPNVVATIDAGEDKGYCYLVLELVEGATLRQLMAQRNQPFAAIEAAHLVAEVARGLHALHTATDEQGRPLNVVHRDLSPHNVMLDQSGRAVLIDLGLAKADSNVNLTQVGVLCGKLPYMSPEQARLETLDARSDVFALGTVLYELCTSKVPFGDTHTTATLERLQRCDAAEIEAGLREVAVPSWIVDIVLGCLRADPADRYATALDVADALTQELACCGHSSAEIKARLADIVRVALPEIGTVTPLEPMAPALTSRGGRSMRWMALGAAAALVVFGGLYGTVRLLPTMGTKAPNDAMRFEAGSIVSDPPSSGLMAEEPASPQADPPRLDPASVGPPSSALPSPSAEPGTIETNGSSEPMAETDGVGAETGAGGETSGGEIPRRMIRRKVKRRDTEPTLRERNPYAQ